VGLGQISIRIPNLPPGTYPLAISGNAQTSNIANITVAVTPAASQLRQLPQ